jgi:non-ribosomal peptide synthetase component F
MYMASLATLNLLLSRYTGQEDILVGTAIAGRHKNEVENLIGQFINMLVMRTKLHGDPTFRELLGQVRETTLRNYGHQAMPIGTLIKEFAPNPDPSYPPLAQVAFTLHHEENRSTTSTGLTSVLRSLETGRAALDLLVSMDDNTRGLFATITYNIDLFNHSTIELMLNHFKNLLEAIVEDSGRRVSELLVSVEDKSAI